jgi:hypothetical protein
VRGFVSKVPNGEGATAVRVEWKRGRERVRLEHVGTGRSREDVALLVQEAWERVNADQGRLWEDAPQPSAGGAGPGSRGRSRPRSRTVVYGTTISMVCDVCWAICLVSVLTSRSDRHCIRVSATPRALVKEEHRPKGEDI